MGRSINTTGYSSSVTVGPVTTTYNASINERILVDTTSAAFSITIPQNSDFEQGESIQIIDIGHNLHNNPVTLSSSSILFADGGSGDNSLLLDIPASTTTLILFDDNGTRYWAVSV